MSILQASLVSYGAGATGSTPDGSNRQYASDTEITNALLEVDGEVSSLICKTPQHPYQSQFVASPATVVNGANLPIRNGMILRIQTIGGAVPVTTFVAAGISVATNLVTTSTAHGLITGQPVQLTASGSLPTGLSLATTYYIIVPMVNGLLSTTTYGFATSLYTAKSGTLIDITNIGSGTNTVTTQLIDASAADSKDTVIQMTNSPYLFASAAGVGWNAYFIEGDKIFTPSPSLSITYTDYTLTSALQAPQPYIWADIAGAVSRLVKDGSDEQMAAYYGGIYQGFLGEIARNAMMIPSLQAYSN